MKKAFWDGRNSNWKVNIGGGLQQMKNAFTKEIRYGSDFASLRLFLRLSITPGKNANYDSEVNPYPSNEIAAIFDIVPRLLCGTLKHKESRQL
jgi:hypothetical protein